MPKLEDLSAGTRLSGLVASGVATVESVQWIGQQALKVIFRDGEGQLGERLLYRLHVSERLLNQHDGQMLEALKQLNGGTLHLPARAKDYPDRNRLALRFERFKAAA